MQVLSLARFSSIEYVIKGGDYNYISAHLAVDIPEDASLFAKIQMDADSAQWYVDGNEKYKKISDASEEDRLAALQDLKVRRERILQKLQGTIPYAESLFTIPSEDQIFYTKSGGSPRALLCQWGFRKRNDAAKKDTISFLLATVPDPPEPLDVRFVAKGSDGKPMGNAPFRLEWLGKTQQDFMTDEEGVYSLGSMMPGTQFSVVDADGKENPFTVVADVAEYSVVVPVYASVEVKVVNQADEPKSEYKIALDNVEVMTDKEGTYRQDQILLSEGSMLTVSDESGHSEAFPLERGENQFIYRISDHFYSSLRILTQWNDGEPIPEFSVVVNEGGYISDASGVINLQGMDAGAVCTIYPADNLADKQVVTLERGENEVIIQKTKVPPRNVRIRLLDHKSRPLGNLHVSFKLAAGPYEADTDDQGCIYIPESLFTDKEKVSFQFEYDSGKKKLK